MFDYINKLTPADVALLSAQVDIASSTIVISGKAPSLEAVNRYVDTLKFADYKTESGQAGRVFSSVTTSLNRFY